MGPVARALAPLERARLARHFAALPSPTDDRRPAPADPGLLQQGAAVAATGVPSRGIPACRACHSTGAAPGTAPDLQGQTADYLERQLALWRNGTRLDGAESGMAAIARDLTPGEAAATALYFATIAPHR